MKSKKEQNNKGQRRKRQVEVMVEDGDEGDGDEGGAGGDEGEVEGKEGEGRGECGAESEIEETGVA